MKLIEFKAKPEGQALSDAFITFGKRVDSEGKNRGLYLCFFIYAFKSERYDFYLNSIVKGWFGYRVTFGYYILFNRKVKLMINGWWELLKRESIITQESILNNLDEKNV